MNRSLRVGEIVRLKCSRRWRRGTSAKLAAEWGVGVGYVHELACDANKVIRRNVDADAIAAEVIPDLRRLFRLTVDLARFHPDLHVRAVACEAVAKIGRLLANIAGLIQPKHRRIEVSTTGVEAHPSGVTVMTDAPANDLAAA